MKKKLLKFGQVFKNEILQAKNIDTFIYSNVINLKTNNSGKKIKFVNVASLNGNKFTVKAKHFILATGGIENARLLLLSNKNQNNGLGNENDLVGRFFMEHIKSQVNLLQLSNPKFNFKFYNFPKIKHVYMHPALTLTEEYANKLKIKNCAAHCHVWSKYALNKQFSDNSINELGLDHLSKNLNNIATNLDQLNGNNTQTKNIEFKNDTKCVLSIKNEMDPNPNNRVQLAHSRDRLGLNQTELNFQLDKSYEENLLKFLYILGHQAGENSVGRVKINAHLLNDVVLQAHHMGTTRMADNPKQGVVDKNCKLHSVSNLYITGGSVFPTSSHVNPTLTIIALSIRLADHLKNKSL